jgi:hypothetical protein
LQISHIPKIDLRSKAKNIPKNTQNDNEQNKETKQKLRHVFGVV